MGLYADELLHGTPAGRSTEEDAAPPARYAPSTTTRHTVRRPPWPTTQPGRWIVIGLPIHARACQQRGNRLRVSMTRVQAGRLLRVIHRTIANADCLLTPSTAVRCRFPADRGRQRSPETDRSLSPPPARRPAYSPRAQEVRGNDGGRGEAREATFYVGGLNYSTPADKVKSFFSRLGHIREFKLIIDRETSQSKGYGFLTFEV
jgi:hypothetical protein